MPKNSIHYDAKLKIYETNEMIKGNISHLVLLMSLTVILHTLVFLILSFWFWVVILISILISGGISKDPGKTRARRELRSLQVSLWQSFAGQRNRTRNLTGSRFRDWRSGRIESIFRRQVRKSERRFEPILQRRRRKFVRKWRLRWLGQKSIFLAFFLFEQKWTI